MPREAVNDGALRLHKSKEETNDYKALKIMYNGSHPRYQTPDNHAAREVE
jgi:hypothetical protein